MGDVGDDWLAAEFRRLHASNAELLAALKYIIDDLELRASFKLGDKKGLVDIGHGAYMQGKDAIANATKEHHDH